MVPILFPEATKELNKPNDMTEDECSSLHVYEHQELNSLLSCWKMSWKERISALLFGKVWLWVRNGTQTQPPVSLLTKRDVF